MRQLSLSSVFTVMKWKAILVTLMKVRKHCFRSASIYSDRHHMCLRVTRELDSYLTAVVTTSALTGRDKSVIPLRWADKGFIAHSLQLWQNFDLVRRRPPSEVHSSQLLLGQLSQSAKSLCLFGFVNLRFIAMQRAWAVFKAHPYISNVLGYTTLFASADLIQQSMLGGKHAAGSMLEDPAGIDWSQTARVATVGFCFHANFNYHWLKGLERMLPGGGVKVVTGKVVMDQLIAAPLTISAFYIGLSLLENKADLLEDWRQKFWSSYKTGVVFCSTMQAVNFALVPPVARTVFLGGIALAFTIYLCHLRQQRGHKLE